MPIESDLYTGGTGGGSTTSVCSISPSDNIAVLNNYGSRISDIERFLSRVVAADVYASNLADLAENLGNVLNGTLMLPSTTNSPYGPGGSIPVPDGYNGTVISGNVITTWTDGVVSFEVINTQGGTRGGGLSYALFTGTGGSIANGPGGTTVSFSTVTSQNFVTNNTTSLTLSPGNYLLVAAGGSTARTSTSASIANVRFGSESSGVHQIAAGWAWAAGESTTSTRSFTGACINSFPVLGDSNLVCFAQKLAGSATTIMGTIAFAVAKLGV